eukprot:scaffold1095_cov63-Phaeocystis_antarctica.AAC.8
MAGQTRPERPIGRGWPALGAAPGPPSGGGEACSAPFWPKLGAQPVPVARVARRDRARRDAAHARAAGR